MVYTESIGRVVRPGSLKEEDIRGQLLWLLNKMAGEARGINMPRLKDETKKNVHRPVGNQLFSPRTTWASTCNIEKSKLGNTHMFVFNAEEDQRGTLVLRGMDNRGKLVILKVHFIPDVLPPVITGVELESYDYWEIGDGERCRCTTDDYFGDKEYSVALFLVGLTNRLEELVKNRQKGLDAATALSEEVTELERLVIANGVRESQ